MSFTPFIGFHFVLAAAVTMMMCSNLIASAVGTVVGNPITFPFIWIALLSRGSDPGTAGKRPPSNSSPSSSATIRASGRSISFSTTHLSTAAKRHETGWKEKAAASCCISCPPHGAPSSNSSNRHFLAAALTVKSGCDTAMNESAKVVLDADVSTRRFRDLMARSAEFSHLID